MVTRVNMYLKEVKICFEDDDYELIKFEDIISAEV